MTFPIRPLHDTVFIRRVDPPRSSIIITPDSAKGSPKEGIVLAVGPGRVLPSGVFVPSEVKPGDHVWFIEGFPAEMNVGGEHVLRLNERDLLAVRHRGPKPLAIVEDRTAEQLKADGDDRPAFDPAPAPTEGE